MGCGQWYDTGTWGLSGGEREPWRIAQGKKAGSGPGPARTDRRESGSGNQSLALQIVVAGLCRPLVVT